tara:strand:- start:234 stop:746 length:513 start_codon:yes stop_codon:yes gene_type:complete
MPCPLSHCSAIVRRAAGFTLVELIAVIALLGILSAVAISQFGNTQTYHDLQLKDQLISTARVAQQTALNRYNQTVTLEVSRPGDWLLEVKADGLPLKRQLIAASAAQLFAPGGAQISGSTPYVVGYDNLGNLASGATANLSFDGASAHLLCITVAGYAYQAASSNDCQAN